MFQTHKRFLELEVFDWSNISFSTAMGRYLIVVIHKLFWLETALLFIGVSCDKFELFLFI